MNRKAVVTLVVALVVVAFAAAAIASSIGGSGDTQAPTHVMPGGQTMEGSAIEATPDQGSMDGMEMDE